MIFSPVLYVSVKIKTSLNFNGIFRTSNNCYNIKLSTGLIWNNFEIILQELLGSARDALQDSFYIQPFHRIYRPIFSKLVYANSDCIVSTCY